MKRFIALLTNLFPVWVLAGGAMALVRPSWFSWFTGPWITWGLGVIMLGMGITLSLEDFKAVLRTPWAVGVGFVAQYSIMPLLGWSLARLFELQTPLAVGLILVSCCPGGTASNVVTYLAGANVPLSVLMTMCSTFGAIGMTPLLTDWLAGAYVPVPAWEMFLSTLQIVLAPLVLGLSLHHLTPRLVKLVLPIAPLISVVVIVLICASIIGTSAEELKQSGIKILLAVLLLHGGGFFLGYGFAWLLRFSRRDCRTISIEVGMQNSGLGATLAKRHFPQMPSAALPCAISATCHSVLGSLLAGLWRWLPTPEPTSPPNTLSVLGSTPSASGNARP